jgi:hypothetical protein
MDTRTLTRPAAPRKLRLTLTAGQAAAAARREVRAAIRAWDVPVDPSIAVLLTGDLVANALRHQTGSAIELVVSYAHGQLQVDVYDTSPAVALPADRVTLLTLLSTSWGYYRAPNGRAGYFTLIF